MTLALPATERGNDLYLELMKRILTNVIYRDAPIPNPVQPLAEFDPSLRATGRDWPSVAHTMVGRARLDNVQECIATAIRDEVPGDLVETGVWRGGTTIFMRAVLEAYGDRDRLVWAVDSFQGMPETGPESHPGDQMIPWTNVNNVLAVPLETVQANFAAYGLLDDQVRFLPGWFRDTLPGAPIKSIAVLRLDGDMYDSTMDALTSLYAKVSPGGFVIVDDYMLPACREAIEDFRSAHGVTAPLVTIDQDAVFWRVPA